MGTQQFPTLRYIPPAFLASHPPAHPTLKIHLDRDVQHWRETRGYQDYALFLNRLNESVVGHLLPLPTEPPPSEVSLLRM
jgi:serine/threonine-protein phosphatase 2A activator